MRCLSCAVDAEESGAAEEDGEHGAEVEYDELAVACLEAVAEEGEVMDEGPGDEDVAEAKGCRPARAKAEDDQEGADKVREEGDEEANWRRQVQDAGEMRHEGGPVRGAFFPSVAEKKRSAGGNTQDGEAEAGGCGEETGTEKVLKAAHGYAFQVVLGNMGWFGSEAALG